MIETTWTFFKRNVCKHSRRIVATSHPYLSGVLSAWIVFGSDITIKPFVLAGFFIPYDAVVFGFTATSVALSIALPSERFIKFLSGIRDGRTPFKDFLFILAWNGIIHIFAFFLFIPTIFMDNALLISPGDPSAIKAFMFIAIWVQFYAGLQFLVTTIGVYELADLYGTYCANLRREDDKNSKT